MKLIIDVSEFNGKIDWAKAATHIDGAIIRVGYRGWAGGSIVRDTMAIENLRSAVHNNIPVGLYFVTQAICTAEAIEEAQFCHDVAHLAGVKPTLPVCFDDEPAGGANGRGRRDMLGAATRTQTARSFSQQCIRLGYRPALYCSASWYTDKIYGKQLSSEGMLSWIASYPSTRNGALVKPEFEWAAWQFTPYGAIPGIDSDVDVSYFKEGAIIDITEFTRLMQEYRAGLQDNDAETWSQAARSWAIKTGLMQGGTSGNYMWQDFMTREQLATVLYRFARMIGKA